MVVPPLHGLEDAAHHFSMALIASGTGAAVVYPIDMAKTKLQAAGPGGEGLNELQIICSTFREEGLAGVYSGLGAQLVGVAPEKSVKFFAYGLAHHTGVRPQSGAGVLERAAALRDLPSGFGVFLYYCQSSSFGLFVSVGLR